VGLAALAHAGCVTSTASHAPAGTLGTLELRSTSIGTRTLQPAACRSGERQMFLGADFLDPREGLTARLLVEPTGLAALRVFPGGQPLDPGVIFRKTDCATFQLSLARTGWRIDDVYDLRATLEVDCQGPSGDFIKGRLAVDHCH
jgi:hypothetical protein